MGPLRERVMNCSVKGTRASPRNVYVGVKWRRVHAAAKKDGRGQMLTRQDSDE